ncbi:MAG TPA: TolC family protein [Saprospiraceae bacterium]|nr:TolC family protein [Saprospiraceae bacterium]
MRHNLPNLLFTAVLLLSCHLLLPISLQAQSAVLENYIQEGLNTSLQLKQQGLDIARQQELLRQAKSLGMPKFTFDANYTLAAGGRRIDFPIGDLLNNVYGNLNALNAVPGNLPPGVVPGVFPTLENQQIQFLPNNFHETKISFTYPVFNSDLKYNRQIQQHLLDSKTAEKAAGTEDLRYQITEAYLQYLRTLEAEKIWLNTRTVLTELRRFNESLVKNNVATRDVVATADYELSKADNEIYTLRRQQENVQAWFNFLLNKELNAPIEVDSALLKMPIPAYQPQDLVVQSLENRHELDALKSGQLAAETDVRRNAANLKLPDLYLGGSFGFQGFGYTFSKEQAYVLAQVGLSYDLFDGGLRRSKTQEARLQAETVRAKTELAEQQITLQVTTAWHDLEAAQNSFQSSSVALRAAEETFRIINNKYRAGQALLLEYLDAQNRVTTARLQQVIAWSEVLLKEAALKKAAGI